VRYRAFVAALAAEERAAAELERMVERPVVRERITADRSTG
jgi:hypothetical protein